MSAELAPVADEPEFSYDLDAVLAEREEKSPFTFPFDGAKYVLPPRPDIRAAAALSAGRLDDGLRLLLGTEQWDRMQASTKVFDDEALVGLLDAYMAHTGEDLGKSKASTRSSRNTAKR